MRHDAGRAALWLGGAVLVVAGLLGLWLARRAAEDAADTAARAARSAPDSAPAPPLPRFDVQPLAAEDALAAGAPAVDDAAGSPAGPLGEIVAPLRALVVHADGTPAAGAAVVAATGEIVIDTQITGSDGAAAFSITAGRVELYVGGATLTPQRFEIEPAHGEHRLELPAGAFVGGIALLDGQPPEEPITLTLASDGDEPAWEAPGRVMLALARAETGHLGQPIGLQTTEGRFLFGGLPSRWSGWIEIPWGLRLEGQSPYDGYEVREPSTTLVVRLIWDAAVTGRVIAPADGPDGPAPVAQASLTYRVERDSGTFADVVESGDDGRFRVPLHADEPAQVQLQILAADGDGRLALELEDVDPHVGRDLGDVRLLPTRRVRFVALNDAGAPIEGALAIALDATRARSDPTGIDGVGELTELLPTTEAMRVVALGYQPEDVLLPREQITATATDAGPLRVVLSRAPRLDLHVVTPDGAPAGGVIVTYRATGKPFASGEHTIDPMQVELGASACDFNGFDGRDSYGRFTLGSDGRGLITGLLPGMPLALGVTDRYGTRLRAPELITLGAGEQRDLEWIVDGRPRRVRVIVQDTEGKPIGGARVRLVCFEPRVYEGESNPGEQSQYTGRDGIAEFPNVFAARGSVQADHEEFSPAWLIDQALPAGGQALELRLAPGRTIDIEVVGADGKRRRVDDVSMVDGPVAVTAEPVEEGLHRLANAPPGTITLRALLGRRPYTAQHETSQPRARIELPALGSLRARWTVPLQADQTYTVLARCVQPDDWSRYFVVHETARAASGPIGFGDLLPGVYEVVLRQGRGWTGDNPPVSQVARVTVTGGQVTEVLLEP